MAVGGGETGKVGGTMGGGGRRRGYIAKMTNLVNSGKG